MHPPRLATIFKLYSQSTILPLVLGFTYIPIGNSATLFSDLPYFAPSKFFPRIYVTMLKFLPSLDFILSTRVSVHCIFSISKLHF
jgi:hypothetical protein